MKKIFYIYWCWLLLLILLLNIGLVLPLWTVNIFKVILFLNFAFVILAPLLKIMENYNKLTKIDHKYLEGIFISIILRCILYCFSFYRLDQRWYILAWVGILMLGYYIFEIRLKIKDIEKHLQ